jgi:hypothetical protein
MNIFMLTIGVLFFLISIRLTYEAWIVPDKFAARINSQRSLYKKIFGFNLTEDNKFYRAIGKFVSLFFLLMSTIVIVVSIRGPFTYSR